MNGSETSFQIFGISVFSQTPGVRIKSVLKLFTQCRISFNLLPSFQDSPSTTVICHPIMTFHWVFFYLFKQRDGRSSYILFQYKTLRTRKNFLFTNEKHFRHITLQGHYNLDFTFSERREGRGDIISSTPYIDLVQFVLIIATETRLVQMGMRNIDTRHRKCRDGRPRVF